MLKVWHLVVPPRRSEVQPAIYACQPGREMIALGLVLKTIFEVTRPVHAIMYHWRRCLRILTATSWTHLWFGTKLRRAVKTLCKGLAMAS